MTELEKGICVSITDKELYKLKNKTGYLDRKNYPDNYTEMALENEVGRFLFFRILT